MNNSHLSLYSRPIPRHDDEQCSKKRMGETATRFHSGYLFKLLPIFLFIAYTPLSKAVVITYEFTTTISTYDDMPDPGFRDGFGPLGFLPVAIGDTMYGRFSWDTSVTGIPTAPGKIVEYFTTITDGLFLQIGPNTLSSSTYRVVVRNNASIFSTLDAFTFDANSLRGDQIFLNGNLIPDYLPKDPPSGGGPWDPDGFLAKFSLSFTNNFADALSTVELPTEFVPTEWTTPEFGGGFNACQHDIGDCANAGPGSFSSVGGSIPPGNIAAVVPIPAAFWLFGSAIGLLGWMRRKSA